MIPFAPGFFKPKIASIDCSTVGTSVVLLDNFTGTNGTLLSAHSPDTGPGVWTSAYGDESRLNGSGIAGPFPPVGYGNPSAQALYIDPTQTFTVEATFKLLDDPASYTVNSGKLGEVFYRFFLSSSDIGNYFEGPSVVIVNDTTTIYIRFFSVTKISGSTADYEAVKVMNVGDSVKLRLVADPPSNSAAFCVDDVLVGTGSVSDFADLTYAVLWGQHSLYPTVHPGALYGVDKVVVTGSVLN